MTCLAWNRTPIKSQQACSEAIGRALADCGIQTPDGMAVLQGGRILASVDANDDVSVAGE